MDLSEAFVRNQVAGELTEQLTIYSIVNSLTEYYGVDSVQFLIDGQPREYYKSHVLINTPLIFNEELVETEED
ncbi:MAG: GerMN domain-containing protein [Firmicutes bacterium]|nr:GerMN domain-containing protein [Bacillota bacterium]